MDKVKVRAIFLSTALVALFADRPARAQPPDDDIVPLDPNHSSPLVEVFLWLMELLRELLG